MDNGLKKSACILGHELKLQVYTAGSLLICCFLSICLVKFTYPLQPEYAKTFIVFYTAVIGFVLPWQMNTNGNISPGYCRYHLSLPVHSWQLYFLPLVFRLLLMSIYIGLEYLLYKLLYQCGKADYFFNAENMLFHARVSFLIYFVIQAYGWSKDSFKNLYLYLGIAFAVCVLVKPEIIAGAVDFPWFVIIIVVSSVLSIIGVIKLRVGRVIELPGLRQMVLSMNRKGFKERAYNNMYSAHFHQEWRRMWYIMPLSTLLIMLILMILDYKTSRASAYFLQRDIEIVSIFFFLISLVIPLIGILGAGNFKLGGGYINHLPISSRSLADIKIKCFFLSYAISFTLFLAFVIFKLFAPNTTLLHVKYSRCCIFFNALNARSMEFFQHPGVVIWSLIAAFIWAFVLASLMVVICINRNNRLRVFMFPVWGLFIYAFLYLVDYAVKNQLLAIPRYFYIMTVICAIPAIKLAFLYLRYKKLMIKIVTVVIICILSAGYNYLMNKAAIAVVVPILLILIYPVAALRQSTKWQRQEINDHSVELPWKLIILVSAVILSFGLYTYIINVRQEKELHATMEQMSFYSPKKIPVAKWSDIALFVKRNMPDYPASFTKDLDNYIMNSKNNYGPYKLLHCIDFLNAEIIRYYEAKKYKKAFDLLLFKLELMDRYDQAGDVERYIYMLNYILDKYQPSSQALDGYVKLLKRINKRNNYLLRGKMKNVVWRINSPKHYTTLLLYRSHVSSRCKAGMLNMTPLFLSPLCLNDKLSRIKTAFYFIKCLDYQVGACNEPGVLELRANFRLIQHDLWGDLKLLDVNCKKSVIVAAMYNYKIKYDKFPDNLNDLVPAYLNDRDLVLFDDYKQLFGSGLATRLPSLLIRANKEDIMKFMNWRVGIDHD